MDPYEKAARAFHAHEWGGGWDADDEDARRDFRRVTRVVIDAFLADAPRVCGRFVNYPRVGMEACGLSELAHETLFDHPFVPAALVLLGDTDE